MRLIPPDFHFGCYCIKASRTGTWNRDTEALFEMSQVEGSIPLKPVGSKRAFQNGNVNFLNCITAFL